LKARTPSASLGWLVTRRRPGNTVGELLLAHGLAASVILMLSLETVRNHVSNIFGKFQVSDRSAAIVTARDAGFGAAARRPG
jgi:hypothetical protein